MVVHPADQLREIARKLEELANHYKWIKRAEEGWSTEGLVEEGLFDRIEQAYNALEDPENVALLGKLGIQKPSRSKWAHFRKH